MSEAHLTRDVLEQYVIGALEAEPARQLEGHVGGCQACAELLRREALLETRLFELAQLPVVTAAQARAGRRWARPLALATAAAAMAAGVALVMLEQPGEPPKQGEPRVVRCDDPRSASECVARAHFDGLLSLGPGGGLEVPRYDEQPGGRRGGP